ncbi:MAG: tetratricopeptide repeat protein [Chitinophagales bacterium]
MRDSFPSCLPAGRGVNRKVIILSLDKYSFIFLLLKWKRKPSYNVFMSGKKKKSLPVIEPIPGLVKPPAEETDLFTLLWKLAPIVILIITAFIFSRAALSDFTSFDDDNFILKNPLVQDSSPEGILKIFTTFSNGKYQPFTTLTFALQYRFFGFNPFVFHLTNIILHLLSTFIVFKIAEKLSGNRITAVVVALLFGIHPMHVEEVAWASELKDMLYAFFYVFAMLVYLRYMETGYRIKYYLAVFLLFIVSLFSKPEASTLPLVMLIIDVYKSRKITLKVILEKIPLLVFSVVIFTLGFLSMQADGAIRQLSGTYGFINRMFLFTTVPAFYIVKLIAPFHLAAIHYYPELRSGLLPFMYYLSLPFMLVIAWLVVRRSSFRKEILFGASFFLVTICVMPQIINGGLSLTPERYSYLPYFGFFYIIGQWIATIGIERWTKPVISVFCGFVFIFCVLTWLRIAVWKNDNTLFTDICEKNADIADCSYFYWLNGNYEVKHENLSGALKDYTRAIAQHPNYPEAYANRGAAYFQSGDLYAAIADYSQAIRYKPNYAMYYYNRASARATFNDFNGALADYNLFLKMEPRNNTAYTDRGMVRLNLKDSTGACEDWRKATEMGNQSAPQLMQQFCHK